MASNCYSCIMDRAKFECDMVFSSDKEKRAAMEELLDFMVLHKGGVPALVGTQREVIIKRHSGNMDPYRELKVGSNAVARDLLVIAERFYEGSKDKLEALIRIASAANSMEFGVKGHDFENDSFGKVFEETLSEALDGDLSRVRGYLEGFEKILYLTDNAGEIVFDLFVIGKLEEMGKRVVIGPKAEPVLNDVTAKELSGMTDRDIVATGDVVGLSLERTSDGLLELLMDDGWLVLAKGMGNFETMTEFDSRLKGRLIYVLRAKCEPVADELGVPRGTLVVRAV